MIQNHLRCFETLISHYSNLVDNVLAATHNLAAISINGDSPVERESRNTIAMLKTVVTQQANYCFILLLIKVIVEAGMSSDRQFPAMNNARGHSSHPYQPQPVVSDAHAIVDVACA